MIRFSAHHRLHQAALTLLSLSLIVGCGKDEAPQPENMGTSLRGTRFYQGGQLYQIGDQVRNRFQLKTASGSKEMEIILLISGVNENHSAYEVQKFQVISSVKSLVGSEWRSSETLSDLVISNEEELKTKCTASQGRMGTLTVSGQPFPVCRTKAPWTKGSRVIGRCDVWLAVLPFGVFKESCTSRDGRQSLVSEALSAVVHGSHRYF